MDGFLHFFDGMPFWQKGLWLAFVLALCWVLEAGIPLYGLQYRKWRHAANNFTYLAMSGGLNALFGPVILFFSVTAAESNFGLLRIFDWPVWAELLVAVAALDFVAQYGAHWLLHNVPLLFRFHRVHHSDTAVDATTATRHHPVDFLVREVLSALVVLVIGAPAAYYAFYRMVTIFFGYTSHANFTQPHWIDQTIGWVLITPNMHKFHHHDRLPWTDTNYGNVFSFWDRICGTLVIDDPKKVTFGLDIMDPAKRDDVAYQLASPWDRSIRPALATPVSGSR